MIDKYGDFGWLEGDLDSAFLNNMHHLFDLAIRHPQVDRNKVYLFGFSAGGYGLTEMIASQRGLCARAIVLGGIHGHGNTVEDAIKCYPGAKPRQEILDSFADKWSAYLQRMRNPPPRHVLQIFAVHNVKDTLSPWGPAQSIVDALDTTRAFQAIPSIHRILIDRDPSNTMGQAAHNYGKEAFQCLYTLLADVVRENPTIQDDSEVIGHGDLLPQPLPPVGLTTIGVDHLAPFLPSQHSVVQKETIHALPPPAPLNEGQPMEYVIFQERDDHGFPRDWCLLCHAFTDENHTKTETHCRRMGEAWRFKALPQRPFTYCPPIKPVGRLGDPIRPKTDQTVPHSTSLGATNNIATNTKKPSMSPVQPVVDESPQQLGTDFVDFFELRENNGILSTFCLLCNRFSDPWHLITDGHQKRVKEPWFHKGLPSRSQPSPPGLQRPMTYATTLSQREFVAAQSKLGELRLGDISSAIQFFETKPHPANLGPNLYCRLCQCFAADWHETTIGHRTRAGDSFFQEHLTLGKAFRPLPSASTSIVAADLPRDQKSPLKAPEATSPAAPIDDVLEESRAASQDEHIATIDVVKEGASWTIVEQGLTITMSIAPPLVSNKKKVMVIFHGSFAPMHPGHCAMINDALDFLHDNDIEVRVAALSVTFDHQLENELDYIPRGWTAVNRIQFARYMLVDANLDQVVTVADRCFSSPYAHATTLDLAFPAIYVYGSDRWKHAATTKIDSNNLVVMRGKDHCAPTFDHSRLAGKCNQTSGMSCRFVSSSGVRDSLVAQHVPECYGRATKEYLSTVFGPDEEVHPLVPPADDHIHEEIVYTEEDDWPVIVEEDFHDALDGLPLSPVLHDYFGDVLDPMDLLPTDSCAAAATTANAVEASVTFACNAEVKEFHVDNISRAVKKKIVRPIWLPQPNPLDDILSSDDDGSMDADDPDFHDVPEQQDLPGFWIGLPTWKRWLRRPATPSYYACEDDPAQAHQVWAEAILAGPPGPVEIHYPIVPVQEHHDDWNWDLLLVSTEPSAVREDFALDSKVLTRMPKAYVELVNHWFTTHLAPDVPVELPRRGWITICVKPDDPRRTDLALVFYRRATSEDRHLCRNQGVIFADWQHFAPLKYTGVNSIDRDDPDVPPSQFSKVFYYLTGVVANLLPNQANERIRAWLDRHPRALAGSSGIHLPATTIAPHPNVMKYSGDVRIMPVHVLAPIRGCVGSIHE
eukprot:3948415-Amphidinium_carterae.1